MKETCVPDFKCSLFMIFGSSPDHQPPVRLHTLASGWTGPSEQGPTKPMASSFQLHSERFQSARSAPDSVRLHGLDQPTVRSGRWPTCQPLSTCSNGHLSETVGGEPDPGRMVRTTPWVLSGWCAEKHIKGPMALFGLWPIYTPVDVCECKYNIEDSASAENTIVVFHREYFRYRYLYLAQGNNEIKIYWVIK
jgi:hypothetical protein